MNNFQALWANLYGYGTPESKGYNIPGSTYGPTPQVLGANTENLNGMMTDINGNSVRSDNPTQTNPLTSGGGTGGNLPPQYYNGVLYDMNDPAQRQAYTDAKIADADTGYKQALKNGNKNYASQLAGIRDQLQQTANNQAEYGRQWGQQGTDLAQGNSLGMTQRQNTFQGYGPRAYQSSMGTSGQYAQKQYDQAIVERVHQKNLVDAQFEQAKRQQAQAKSALEGAYTDWVQQAQQQKQTNIDNTANAMTQSGFDASKFSIPKAPQFAQADLSAYTPFTTFSQMANSPDVQGQQNVFANAGVSKVVPQPTDYLGYDPTKPDQNFLDQFLTPAKTAY